MALGERREHCRIPVATHRHKLIDSRPTETSLLRNLRPNRKFLRMRLRILRCTNQGRQQRRSASLSCRITLALVRADLKQLQGGFHIGQSALAQLENMVSFPTQYTVPCNCPSELQIRVEVNLSICNRYSLTKLFVTVS
jgi:hypothetical protein